MDQDAEPAEAGLAVDPGHHVVGKPDALDRAAEDELAGVQHEGRPLRDLDQLGEVGVGVIRVDEFGGVIAKDPDPPAEPHVNARRLDLVVLDRLQLEAALGEQLSHGAVGQDHRAPNGCCQWPERGRWMGARPLSWQSRKHAGVVQRQNISFPS